MQQNNYKNVTTTLQTFHYVVTGFASELLQHFLEKSNFKITQKFTKTPTLTEKISTRMQLKVHTNIKLLIEAGSQYKKYRKTFFVVYRYGNCKCSHYI